VRNLLYAALVLVLWVFAMTMDYPAAQVSEAITKEQVKEMNRANARIAAYALSGENLSWIDPHRGAMMTFCRSYEAPLMEVAAK